MKKLLLIIFVLISTIFNAQVDTSITYPHYFVENGVKVIAITIEQAQKFDNDEELLKLFKQLSSDFNDVDSACVKVVDAQGKEISGLKIQISALKSLGVSKDQEIKNLKDQIIEFVAKDELSKSEIKKKDLIIKEKDHQITRHKWQKIGGFIGGAVAIIALIITLLVK